MTDTLLWVAYLISAGGAFYAVRFQRWPIAAATVAGALITVIVRAIMVLASSADTRPAFLTVDLGLNASFGIIFAGAGAAVAAFLNSREHR